MHQKKTLLFVNGLPPACLPENINQYDYIACTDGAYHNYLQNTAIKPDFIIGDFDSLHDTQIDTSIELIYTPDQNKTDFEKSLLYFSSLGSTKFDIYGASGKASDHFLGNLAVALQYYKVLTLNFYDDDCHFFYAQNNTTIEHVLGRKISLIPFSLVKNLTITGFEFPLIDAELEFTGLMSLRNRAIEDCVHLQFSTGDLLVVLSAY